MPANSTASFNFTDAGFPAPAAKALSQQRLLLYSEHNEAGTLRGSDGGQMVRTRTILPGAARLRLGAATILLALFLSAPGAWALSELQGEDIPVPEDSESGSGEIIREQLPPPPPSPAASVDADVRPPRQVPLPDPVVIPQDTQLSPAEADATDEEEALAIPEVQYDTAALPEPVQSLRAKIMEACLSGDIERLRPLLSEGADGTQLSFGNVPGDPIEFLRSISGDSEGHEILAILYEVMAAGFVLEKDEAAQMYIWPYFYSMPLDTLTAPQRVELFKLVTAGDYEDMKNYGEYIFYRVGITPEGKWQFFVAGD